MDHSFRSECQHADVDCDDHFSSVCQLEQGFASQNTFGGHVSPEHSVEFLHPFAFSFVQTFAQVVEDGVIADFSLAIAFRTIKCGVSIGDFVLSAETGYLLLTNFVVGDGVGEPEATHYVLTEELDNLLPGDFEEWHCLDPFGEIVDGFLQERN